MVFGRTEYGFKFLRAKAIKLAVQSYAQLYKNCKHIRIMSDNTSAIAYINKQGGTRCMAQNELAFEIWEYCRQNDIHISAAHIPGKHNVLADEASRQFFDAAEWSVSNTVFRRLVDAHGMPDIDLFASRLNYKIDTYVSWLPDPESSYIDAMTINWGGRYIYAFPPFSMIWPVLNKILEDKVEKALIVVPSWSTQSWYTLAHKLRRSEITTIASRTLTLPGTTRKHPMSPKLRLQAFICSGCR
jgi:hypothetical protein